MSLEPGPIWWQSETLTIGLTGVTICFGTERLIQSDKMSLVTLWLVSVTVCLLPVTSAQCPWSRKVPTLHNACSCSYNLAQELTLQCSAVDFSALIGALHQYAAALTIDLLYVHNSSIIDLRDGVFEPVTINNLQLSQCDLRRVAAGAFRGQHQSLKNLNLQVQQTFSSLSKPLVD